MSNRKYRELKIEEMNSSWGTEVVSIGLVKRIKVFSWISDDVPSIPTRVLEEEKETSNLSLRKLRSDGYQAARGSEAWEQNEVKTRWGQWAITEMGRLRLPMHFSIINNVRREQATERQMTRSNGSQ